MAEELYRLTARKAVELLRTGKVSPLEMVDAAVARIEAIDGQLNDLPTLPLITIKKTGMTHSLIYFEPPTYVVSSNFIGRGYDAVPQWPNLIMRGEDT